ncbi:MAG: hypothetical protein ACI9MC_000860 [Kiritimatiellia bacterium]|jgi:hypothetical protein
MPNWTQLQEYVRKKYTLESDKQSMMSMVWVYDDGRHQRIVVRRYKAFGRDMIEFKSPFAHTSDATPEQLLRKNAELPLATIALSGDVYLAVYNMLLEHMDLSDFDLVVSRVAHVADKLEAEYAHRDDF